MQFVCRCGPCRGLVTMCGLLSCVAFVGLGQSVGFVRAAAGRSEIGKGNTPWKETETALEIMSSISVRFLTFGNNVR